MQQNPIIGLDEGLARMKSEVVDRIVVATESGQKRVYTTTKEFIDARCLVYDMCTQRSPYNWTRQLYQFHGESIGNYVEMALCPAICDAKGKDETSVAMAVQQQWAKHKFMTYHMNKIFSYIDRWYVKHHGLPTLMQAGHNHFRERIFYDVDENVRSFVLKLINDEREGGIVDSEVIENLVGMYTTLGVYKESLETHFLGETREFYGARQRLWLGECSLPTYLSNVEDFLAKEDKRSSGNLCVSKAKVLQICREELLENVKNELLESREASGFNVLLQSGRIDDLSRFYRLFALIDDGHISMAHNFRSFLESASERGSYMRGRRASVFYGIYFDVLVTSFAFKDMFLHPFLELYINGRTNPDIGRKVMEFL